MKNALLVTLLALTFASCSRNEQYNWVCTSDSTYVDVRGVQHAITRTNYTFKTKAEMELIEKQKTVSGTDSLNPGGVETTCKH